ncbi:hypothetical protein WJX74_003501 [Apatococcus lobatus]|uniref:Uncharacterized protein n=1 Tax=Apatococcus lobatus TaxID=904363 RepID=A0AAW1RZH6_9CHLO
MNGKRLMVARGQSCNAWQRQNGFCTAEDPAASKFLFISFPDICRKDVVSYQGRTHSQHNYELAGSCSGLCSYDSGMAATYSSQRTPTKNPAHLRSALPYSRRDERGVCLEDEQLDLAEQGASPQSEGMPSPAASPSPGHEIYQLSSQSWQYAVGSVCRLKSMAEEHLRPDQHKQNLQRNGKDSQNIVTSLWIS